MIFGPVPSRRLGNSLGINNIPPKECSYSCVYCQLGNTLKLGINRKEYYKTEEIVNAIESHLSSLKSDKKIDYITFVPDGEPTLDINLGKTILASRQFGIKIAVITNASHIWIPEVQNDLLPADWVSLKIDTVDESIWHKIDRPHGSLKLEKILNGISYFSKIYKNFLVTETMLTNSYNSDRNSLDKTAEFIAAINPEISYLTIPTRPPAVKEVIAPDIEKLNNAYQIFTAKKLKVELLLGYEGNEFSATGNFIEDILNITAVHPMRKDAVEDLLKKDKSNWSIVEKLLDEKELMEIKYNDNYFYLRNLKKWRNSN